MNRIIKLVVALVLVTSGFLVAGGAVSGAQAVTEQRATSAATSASTSERATRTAVLKYKRTGRTSFRVWVKIAPAGGRKRAALQYSRTETGTFRTIRKDKPNKKGKAEFGRISKTGYYRVSVPKTKNYPRTYSSNVLHIFRTS